MFQERRRKDANSSTGWVKNWHSVISLYSVVQNNQIQGGGEKKTTPSARRDGMSAMHTSM